MYKKRKAVKRKKENKKIILKINIVLTNAMCVQSMQWQNLNILNNV